MWVKVIFTPQKLPITILLMYNSYYLRVIIYYKSRCEYILIFVHCIFTTNKF